MWKIFLTLSTILLVLTGFWVYTLEREVFYYLEGRKWGLAGESKYPCGTSFYAKNWNDGWRDGAMEYLMKKDKNGK